eukprot:1194632-Prorocentrum_minimum.AAC.3
MPAEVWMLAAAAAYTRSGHRSQKGRENIPVAGTNRRRGERIYPYRAPTAEGEREYTRSGHQPQKGRENIPVAAAIVEVRAAAAFSAAGPPGSHLRASLGSCAGAAGVGWVLEPGVVPAGAGAGAKGAVALAEAERR